MHPAPPPTQMPAHAHSPYVSAKSTDGGKSWQKERMKPSTNDGRQLGCARPRLMSFGKGAPLVMSGGRNLVAVPPPANGEGAFAHESAAGGAANYVAEVTTAAAVVNAI